MAGPCAVGAITDLRMLTALHIGIDDALLRSRTGLLEKAGLRVITAERLSGDGDRIAAENFDLAVLCHSLPADERAALARCLRRRNPAAPILLVDELPAPESAQPANIDGVLNRSPGPLIEGLRRIIENLRSSAPELPEAIAAAGRTPSASAETVARRAWAVSR